MQSRLLAVTPGDPEGIGPEIVLKAIRSRRWGRGGLPQILVIGAAEPFQKMRVALRPVSVHDLSPKRTHFFRSRENGGVWIIPAPTKAPKAKLLLPGFQAGWSIQTATALVRAGVADALVTGPIHKARLQAGGFPYPGHTEFLAALCKTKAVTMMLANDQLRISLVTIHVALRDVPRILNGREIRRTLEQTVQSLRQDWGIRRPRVAVAALNPHAGEGGLFGDEERRIITPAVERLRTQLRAELIGPLPADTLFTKPGFDAVVCMYHDQGLIPVKLLDFQKTVNITLGLPIIRTSVDHGTGFDIAGKGIADPSSLLSAIDLADRFATNRKQRRAEHA